MKKRVGFICGVFDLLHVGHIYAFQEAKQYCQTLIVGLNSGKHFDKTINPNKHLPIFSVEERKIILENLILIDKVYIYNNENELESLIQTTRPDIRFLGEDYKGKKITGQHLVPEIVYLDRSHGRSSTLYKEKIKK